MPTLNDTQTILLSHASQRPDACLLPVPACIRTPPHIVERLLEAFVTLGLAEQRPTRQPEQTWRHGSDGRLSLFATAAGLAAFDGDPADNAQPTVAAEINALSGPPLNCATPTASSSILPKRNSKTARLLAMLQKPSGASIEQLSATFGWLPHSCRAALTGLRKQGHAIDRDKVDGVTFYRVRP